MISGEQKNIIIEVLQPLKPKMIGIFGSYARGENKKGSDLDILVEFRRTVNFLDIIGAELELSKQLNLKVDLITNHAVNPKLAPHIDKDLQKIYNEEG
jgi:predicted nucleotidyltransferase